MNSRIIVPAGGILSRRNILLGTATATLGGLLAAPTAALAQQCIPTPANVLGPFYRPGAPARAKLRSEERRVGKECRL